MTDGVADSFLDAPEFTLTSGFRLPARVAYLTLGTLNAERSNAILIEHGYTSSHRFVLDDGDAAEGSWSDLVGPGRAIDTTRWFVVSSNVLGSCFGTTGPASIHPTLSRPWGADFPGITPSDVVALQRQLTRALGIDRLHAVIGVSMGGLHALQWGMQFPDEVELLVVALSSLHREPGAEALRARLAAQAGWNDGHPAHGALGAWLATWRRQVLTEYGVDTWLAHRDQTPESREREITRLAEAWATRFDPVSLLVLRQMIDAFGPQPALERIRARVMLALCTTDKVFPASLGPAMLAHLHSLGVRAQLQVIDSPFGHMATGFDAAAWSKPLAAFVVADRAPD